MCSEQLIMLEFSATISPKVTAAYTTSANFVVEWQVTLTGPTQTLETQFANTFLERDVWLSPKRKTLLKCIMLACMHRRNKKK